MTAKLIVRYKGGRAITLECAWSYRYTYSRDLQKRGFIVYAIKRK